MNKISKVGEMVLIEPPLSESKKSKITFLIKDVGKFCPIDEKNFQLPIIGNFLLSLFNLY